MRVCSVERRSDVAIGVRAFHLHRVGLHTVRRDRNVAVHERVAARHTPEVNVHVLGRAKRAERGVGALHILCAVVLSRQHMDFHVKRGRTEPPFAVVVIVHAAARERVLIVGGIGKVGVVLPRVNVDVPYLDTDMVLQFLWLSASHVHHHRTALEHHADTVVIDSRVRLGVDVIVGHVVEAAVAQERHHLGALGLQRVEVEQVAGLGRELVVVHVSPQCVVLNVERYVTEFVRLVAFDVETDVHLLALASLDYRVGLDFHVVVALVLHVSFDVLARHLHVVSVEDDRRLACATKLAVYPLRRVAPGHVVDGKREAYSSENSGVRLLSEILLDLRFRDVVHIRLHLHSVEEELLVGHKLGQTARRSQQRHKHSNDKHDTEAWTS